MNLCVNSKVKPVTCTNKFWNNAMHLNIAIILFCTLDAIYMADDSWIDEDHLQKYPYCGRMRTSIPSATGSERIVNSVDATESYRWVVMVTRKTLQVDGSFLIDDCSGSVITERFECK